jgi:hypothetical protein
MLTVNGMIALETALEAARLSGEVITTPYSFVATAHAIARLGLEPVFVDVHPSDQARPAAAESRGNRQRQRENCQPVAEVEGRNVACDRRRI